MSALTFMDLKKISIRFGLLLLGALLFLVLSERSYTQFYRTSSFGTVAGVFAICLPSLMGRLLVWPSARFFRVLELLQNYFWACVFSTSLWLIFCVYRLFFIGGSLMEVFIAPIFELVWWLLFNAIGCFLIYLCTLCCAYLKRRK